MKRLVTITREDLAEAITGREYNFEVLEWNREPLPKKIQIMAEVEEECSHQFGTYYSDPYDIKSGKYITSEEIFCIKCKFVKITREYLKMVMTFWKRL